MLLYTYLVHYLDNGIEISSPYDSSETDYSQEVESNLSKVMFDKWKIFLSTSLCCKHLLLKKVFTGVEKPLNSISQSFPKSSSLNVLFPSGHPSGHHQLKRIVKKTTIWQVGKASQFSYWPIFAIYITVINIKTLFYTELAYKQQ